MFHNRNGPDLGAGGLGGRDRGRARAFGTTSAKTIPLLASQNDENFVKRGGSSGDASSIFFDFVAAPMIQRQRHRNMVHTPVAPPSVAPRGAGPYIPQLFGA